MKFAVGMIVFVWVFCGLLGAWMLDDLNAEHWKKVARGPITLAQALNDRPVSFPGQ